MIRIRHIWSVNDKANGTQDLAFTCPILRDQSGHLIMAGLTNIWGEKKKENKKKKKSKTEKTEKTEKIPVLLAS